MKKDSILLSPKYGLNPSLMRCFTCGEDYGIAIPGRMKEKDAAGKPVIGSDVKAPMQVHMGLCDKCEEAIKKGVFILSVRDGEKGDNPYRTGKIICLKDEAFKKTFPEMEIPEKKIMYMEDMAFDYMFGDVIKKET